MVTKTTFSTFSLSHPDGNYFLRPDRVMGAFFVDRNSPPDTNANSEAELNREIADDEESSKHLMEFFWMKQCNVIKVTAAIKSYWSNDVAADKRDSSQATSSKATSSAAAEAHVEEHDEEEGEQFLKELFKTAHEMPGDIEMRPFSSIVGGMHGEATL
jgi:hypothetical protein